MRQNRSGSSVKVVAPALLPCRLIAPRPQVGWGNQFSLILWYST